MVLHRIQEGIGPTSVKNCFIKDTGHTVTEILKLQFQIRQQISCSASCQNAEYRQAD